ncbi:MAG: PAS domain-containing protein, partial [Acidobacteria bacterium]|nr:PAS domain-containing protein [Acidobacteriota bacterium]
MAIFARAQRGEAGLVEGPDYRGVDAIAVIRPVPNSPWTLVTKIDREELHQQLWQQVVLIGSLTLAVLVATGSTLVWMWRAESRHVLYQRASMAAALGASEERLRLALSAAQQGLYDLDIQTGHSLVSAEYAQMLGYDPATFRETSTAWFDRLHPEDRAAASDAYRAHIEGRRDDYRVEFRQRTASGRWEWILA